MNIIKKIPVGSNYNASADTTVSLIRPLPRIYDGLLGYSNSAQFENGENPFNITLEQTTSTSFVIDYLKVYTTTALYRPLDITASLYYNNSLQEQVTLGDVSTSLNGNILQFNLVKLRRQPSDKIILSFNTFNNAADTFIDEVVIYERKLTPDFEFNDSVLSTKAWNSNRFTGKQLQAANLNTYTLGDTSYKNTPVLSSYTRTFYLASDIISLNNPGSSSFEDQTLQYIPGFSYILLNKALTVNEDNTVEVTDINTFNTNNSRKIGFDRELQLNIPISSKVSLVNIDDSKKIRSRNSYNVYFNRGRLQPLFTFLNGDPALKVADRVTYEPPTTPQGMIIHDFGYTGTNTIDGTALEQDFNQDITKRFYTGSLNDAGYNIFSPTLDIVNTNEYKSFFTQMGEFIENNNESFYITLLNTIKLSRTGSGTYPQYYFTTNPNTPGWNEGDGGIVSKSQILYEVAPIITNTPSSSYIQTEDLSFISTNQITDVNITSGEISMSISTKTPFNQDYSYSLTENSFQWDFSNFTPSVYRGDYTISYLDQDKPALLLKLIKEQEFPDGRGSSPLLVLPENLHPFIKDNLVHFMAKAGFDIGSLTTIPALNKNNINLL